MSAKYYQNKVVLITGAAGSIGSALARKLVCMTKKVVALDIDETALFYLCNEIDVIPALRDIKDARGMDATFKEHNPDVVIHAAAYKHVPMLEKFPEEAIKTNVTGTMVLAGLADKYKVKKFIFISTDKAIKPKSTMGKSKLACEGILKQFGGKTKFAIVRFGNVWGSRGSVVPVFQKQIRLGQPLTVTHPDMERYFITIDTAVDFILNAKEGVSMPDMGEPYKIVDVARELMAEEGVELQIVFTGIRPGEKLSEDLSE